MILNIHFSYLKREKTPLTLQQSCTAKNDIPSTCEKVLPKSYHSELSSWTFWIMYSQNLQEWFAECCKLMSAVGQATERQGNQFSMHQEESKSSVHLPNTNKYSEDWKEAQNFFKAKMVVLNS